MLSSKSFFILVGLLTFSGLTLAEAKIQASLADPNTKLSDTAILSKKEAEKNDVISEKYEIKTEIKQDMTKVSENGPKVEKEDKLTNAEVVSLPDLQVLEFVLSDTVENREPKNIVEGFKQDSKQGFAFARLSSNKASDVTFIWLRNGKEQTRFTTSVHASKKWRTFSSVKLKSGEWTVRLVSGDKTIAEKNFNIQ